MTWGVLGGMVALCSPILGTTWAVVTVWRWLPPPDKSSWKPGRVFPQCRLVAIAALCSIVTVAPWVVRNRLVLGKWIPIKSNFVYEVWKSQCSDDDGVIDGKTLTSHPWVSAGVQRREYAAVGEIAFVAARWPEVRLWINCHWNDGLGPSLP